jgi:hypothetical protein
MKHNEHRVTKLIVASFTIGVVGAVGSGTASATHTHSMKTGNGACVLLAQNGGEKDVTLPHADGADNRRHPLHVNVHLGTPGADGHIDIGVAGSSSDPCDDHGDPIDYLND